MYTIIKQHRFDSRDQSAYGIFETEEKAQTEMENWIRDDYDREDEPDIDEHCDGSSHVDMPDHSYSVLWINLP